MTRPVRINLRHSTFFHSDALADRTGTFSSSILLQMQRIESWKIVLPALQYVISQEIITFQVQYQLFRLNNSKELLFGLEPADIINVPVQGV